MKTYPWLFSKKYQRVLTEADVECLSEKHCIFMLRRKKELWILKENVTRGRLPYSS